MPSLPDTLRVLHAGFDLMAHITASKSKLLGLADLYWSWCLQPERNLLKQRLIVFRSTVRSSFAQQICSFSSTSSWCSSNSQSISSRIRKRWMFICEAWSEAMHNVSAHWLPRYNQPQQVPFTAWIDSRARNYENITTLLAHPYK